MKLAFISDIHGNAKALEAVIKDMERKGVDQVFVLGDLCFRGVEPRRSLELVQSLKADVIKGNADEWVMRGVQKGEVPDQVREVMNRERDWTLAQLDKKSVEYLEKLPTELNLEYGGVTIHVFHATPESLFEVVTPTVSDEVLSEKLMKKNADIFIYAHIHKAYIRYINGKAVINTGSVGLPFDGVKKASYLIIDIEDGNFQTSIVKVGYDVKQVIEKAKASDYPNRDLLIKILENASVN